MSNSDLFQKQASDIHVIVSTISKHSNQFSKEAKDEMLSQLSSFLMRNSIKMINSLKDFFDFLLELLTDTMALLQKIKPEIYVCPLSKSFPIKDPVFLVCEKESEGTVYKKQVYERNAIEKRIAQSGLEGFNVNEDKIPDDKTKLLEPMSEFEKKKQLDFGISMKKKMVQFIEAIETLSSMESGLSVENVMANLYEMGAKFIFSPEFKQKRISFVKNVLKDEEKLKVLMKEQFLDMFLTSEADDLVDYFVKNIQKSCDIEEGVTLVKKLVEKADDISSKNIEIIAKILLKYKQPKIALAMVEKIIKERSDENLLKLYIDLVKMNGLDIGKIATDKNIVDQARTNEGKIKLLKLILNNEPENFIILKHLVFLCAETYSIQNFEKMVDEMNLSFPKLWFLIFDMASKKKGNDSMGNKLINKENVMLRKELDECKKEIVSLKEEIKVNNDRFLKKFAILEKMIETKNTECSDKQEEEEEEEPEYKKYEKQYINSENSYYYQSSNYKQSNNYGNYKNSSYENESMNHPNTENMCAPDPEKIKKETFEEFKSYSNQQQHLNDQREYEEEEDLDDGIKLKGDYSDEDIENEEQEKESTRETENAQDSEQKDDIDQYFDEMEEDEGLEELIGDIEDVEDEVSDEVNPEDLSEFLPESVRPSTFEDLQTEEKREDYENRNPRRGRNTFKRRGGGRYGAQNFEEKYNSKHQKRKNGKDLLDLPDKPYTINKEDLKFFKGCIKIVGYPEGSENNVKDLIQDRIGYEGIKGQEKIEDGMIIHLSKKKILNKIFKDLTFKYNRKELEVYCMADRDHEDDESKEERTVIFSGSLKLLDMEKPELIKLFSLKFGKVTLVEKKKQLGEIVVQFVRILDANEACEFDGNYFRGEKLIIKRKEGEVY